MDLIGANIVSIFEKLILVLGRADPPPAWAKKVSLGSFPIISIPIKSKGAGGVDFRPSGRPPPLLFHPRKKCRKGGAAPRLYAYL